MRILFLSDIHSNSEAFGRIIRELPNLAIDKIVYLGDVLGYGASPKECVELVRQNEGLYILGNYEYEMLHHVDSKRPTRSAPYMIRFSLERLSSRDIEFFRNFSLINTVASCTCVHASPFEVEEFHYIHNALDADRAFRHFDSPLCFIGHTHLPSLFIEGDEHSYVLKPGIVKLEKEKRYIINGGSVGQPRDDDKRLSCVIFDDRAYEIELIRLEYDNRQAAQKIRDEGLPESLADRLL
jgi:predicted phosphodiesterase